MTLDQEKQKKLNAALLVTLDLEQNFKLFSYRLITAEQFIAKFDEVVMQYNTELLKIDQLTED